MNSKKYRINSRFSFTGISNELSIATSEQNGTMIKSEIATKIVRIISEEPITKEDLLNNYFTASSLNEAVLALFQLENSGIITRTKSTFSPEQDAFWQQQGYNTEQLQHVFNNNPVSVKAIGKAEDTTIKKALNQTGIVTEGEPSVYIVVTNSYTAPEINKLNRQFIASGTPWVLIKVTGTNPLSGPIFEPENNESACWECLHHRLNLHDHENKLYKSLTKTNREIERPHIWHPLSEAIVVNSTILEIVKYLYSKKSVLLNTIIEFNTTNNSNKSHTLIKRPQCNKCGEPETLLNHPSPTVLKNSNLLANAEGGYRSVTAAETYNRYKHHISNITGIIPELRQFKRNTDIPIYNYSSGKNIALQSTSMFWLNHHLRSANGGKGKSHIQAKTGAVCEAIERYSIMHHENRYTVKGTYNELDSALHPNSCMLYSDKQYQNRETINSKSTKFYALIPHKFNPDKIIDWTPVYNITEQKFSLLPSEYCYAQYPIDHNEPYSFPDSNGCAAGNTTEEAVLQAFLELIERDAAAIWWYNMIQYRAVDLKSADNEYIDSMVELYRKNNRSLYVLDITTDMNVPVFVAISHNTNSNQKDKIIYAFGAHVDASIALERAIIELNQLFPVVIDDNCTDLKDKNFSNWLNNATIDNQKHMVPLNDKLTDIKQDYKQLCKPTIYHSVRYCIDMAEKNNMQTFIHDLTQPDIKLPVVKVIVPGLRHFWRRTAPGRLYDVPVKMGWLKEPKTEDKLNPVSIFI
jgi:ribosomal protein S12 methylthiotransferase accessory factor